MTEPRRCPGCESPRGFSFVEERRDPIGGVLYRLFRCDACGLVFSEPRESVAAEWYEKAAPLRARESRPAPEKDWRFARFLSAELPPGKLLDVGCGDGGFLALAGARGWRTVGVDYESRMIALARAKGADAHARDFADFLKERSAKEFDAVTMFDVLEHAAEPRDLMALVRPVLKRGGHLALTFPNAERLRPFGTEEHDYPPHHFTRWTTAALRKFLEGQGFEIVELNTYGPSVRWGSETLFYGLIAPAAIAAVRRLAFGKEATGSLSDLYASKPDGALADKSRRQTIVDAAKTFARLLTWPLGAVLALAARLKPRSGEHLYCLARYEG
jgi:SAM-dependent methyltransferase